MARDAKRINDLGQLRTAIDAYLLKKGVLPCTPSSSAAELIDSQTHCLSALVPKYIPELPVDPKFDGDGSTEALKDYQYQPIGGPGQYLLRSGLEDQDSMEITHRYPGSAYRCADDNHLPVAGWYDDFVCRSSSCDAAAYYITSQVAQ